MVSGPTCDVTDYSLHCAESHDAPDTPAPIFAVRALRTALFGDADLDDPTTVQDEKDEAAKGRCIDSQGLTPKPNGILMTPGTATTRRKTVSFGNGVVDNEGHRSSARLRRSSSLSRISSPFDSTAGSGGHKTSLTKKLEESRLSSRCSSASKMSRLNTEDTTSETIVSARVADSLQSDGSLADYTLDLNEPQSQSGKYWKKELETYHIEAKAQMRKLVHHKQISTILLQKKDEEVIDLTDRLEVEQKKTADMAERIVKLMEQIAQHADAQMSTNDTETAFVPKFPEPKGRQQMQAAQQAGKSNLQMNQDSSRDETALLKQSLQISEKAGDKLRRINTKLRQELLQISTRYSQHLDSCREQGGAIKSELRDREDRFPRSARSIALPAVEARSFGVAERGLAETATKDKSLSRASDINTASQVDRRKRAISEFEDKQPISDESRIPLDTPKTTAMFAQLNLAKDKPTTTYTIPQSHYSQIALTRAASRRSALDVPADTAPESLANVAVKLRGNPDKTRRARNALDEVVNQAEHATHSRSNLYDASPEKSIRITRPNLYTPALTPCDGKDRGTTPSPLKGIGGTTRLTDKLQRHQSYAQESLLSTCGSTRRGPLSPERAAAAKARLEQKRIAKRKAASHGA